MAVEYQIMSKLPIDTSHNVPPYAGGLTGIEVPFPPKTTSIILLVLKKNTYCTPLYIASSLDAASIIYA